MKKYLVCVFMWSVLLLTMITCQSRSEICFTIQYDHATQETYQLKRDIQDVYRELVYGIKEESQILLVLHNLEQFAIEDDMEVTFEKNHLLIIQGDGNGDIIEGTLEANSICVPEVKPKSFLQALFSW